VYLHGEYSYQYCGRTIWVARVWRQGKYYLRECNVSQDGNWQEADVTYVHMYVSIGSRHSGRGGTSLVYSDM